MWYRKDNSLQGYEEKIIRLDAENIIRDRLLLAGKYSPEQQEVDHLVNKVVKKLISTYGTYNNIRNAASGEDLYDLVHKAVTETMPIK